MKILSVLIVILISCKHWLFVLRLNIKRQRVNLTFHSSAHYHICYPVLPLQADVRQPPLPQNSPGVCVWLTPDVPASFVTVEIQLVTALSLVSADPYVMLKMAFDQQWAGKHFSHLFSQQTKIIEAIKRQIQQFGIWQSLFTELNGWFKRTVSEDQFSRPTSVLKKFKCYLNNIKYINLLLLNA